MMFIKFGGSRLAAVSAMLCLTLTGLSSAPALANFVIPAQGSGGGSAMGPCQGCNQVTTTGNALGGDASNNPDGSGSQLDIGYTIPDDHTMYSGTVMTQVVNADGTVTVNTWAVSDFASGGTAFATGYNDSVIPTGGTASITINESNGSGGSFSAGWVVRNFHP